MEEIKFKVVHYVEENEDIDEWEIELESKKEYNQQMLLEEIDNLLLLHGYEFLKEGDKVIIKVERR